MNIGKDGGMQTAARRRFAGHAPFTPRTMLVRAGFVRAVLAAGFVLVGAVALAQQTVYVKTPDAKIRSGPDATSSVVSTPGKGTALTVLETSGTRYKVQAPDGSQGYISRLLVSETKPASGGGALSGLGHSDVQANEAQTVASIRGLSPAAKTMATQKGLPEQCVKWAEKMETDSAKVSASDVDTFLKAEKVGL